MHEKTIPVVLLFSNVAANSNLSINLTTPGVKWSLGGGSPDSLGFSYNVIPDIPNQTTSCIKAISFDDDQLTVVTAEAAPASSSFTLTLALTTDGTDYLQGYCSLNNDAIVYGYFGAERPVQWRNGRISAVLNGTMNQFCPVLMSVNGANAGARVEIGLSIPDGEGAVAWTLGPDYDNSMGLSLYSNTGSIGLSQMNYTANRIVLQTASSSSSSQNTAIGLVAFVTWKTERPRYIYLSLFSDSGVSVNAQVGNTQPQYISPTTTLFTL